MPMEISYTVDPDITKASTIDARFYHDVAAYAVSSERIFARTSQWIGDLGDVVTHGSVLPAQRYTKWKWRMRRL